MKNDYSKALLLVIVCLLGFLLLLLADSCQKAEKYKNLVEQISKYELKEQQFKQRMLKDSSTIASQNQTILSQKEAYQLGLLELKGEIKKVQSQVKQVQALVIKDVDIPYVPNGYADTTGWYSKFKGGDTSKPILDSVLANSIIVPKNFDFNNKWLQINGTVKKESVTINKITLPNENTVTVGYKKTGFLKLKYEPTVEIRNTNPYLTTQNMSNVVIKDKKGLFQKWWFWTAAGAAAGILLTR